MDNTSTSETVAFIAWEAGTLETTHRVCTMSKHITWPVFTFIYI